MSRNCKEYCCRYFHDGSWWGITITAYNFDDAEERVRKLGNLKLDGELVMTIPSPVPKWWVRWLVGLRNSFLPNAKLTGTHSDVRSSDSTQ
jgi:hypothetical protein